MIASAIELPMTTIAEFWQRWQIAEFSLFGSVLRDDFRPDSDIDILITFAPDAKRGLTETLQMQDELETLFDRPVDLVIKSAIDVKNGICEEKKAIVTRLRMNDL